jgi:hypothetical protein
VDWTPTPSPFGTFDKYARTFRHTEYVVSPYVDADRKTVHALVHNEFHVRSTCFPSSEPDPGVNPCEDNGDPPPTTYDPQADYGARDVDLNCWQGATTIVSSSDGGRCYGNYPSVCTYDLADSQPRCRTGINGKSQGTVAWTSGAVIRRTPATSSNTKVTTTRLSDTAPTRLSRTSSHIVRPHTRPIYVRRHEQAAWPFMPGGHSGEGVLPVQVFTLPRGCDGTSLRQLGVTGLAGFLVCR